MKSIDKLREYVDKQQDEYNNHNVSFVWQLITIADEIEVEIERDYMKLPADADGVPIHVGDRLECYANGYEGTFTVFAIGNDTVVGNHDIEWIMDNPSKWFHVASFCRHVKPRTLEDVLRDVWKEALDYAKNDMWRNPEEVFAERADEIRELLGGDAE
jgi:hypothetical protein